MFITAMLLAQATPAATCPSLRAEWDKAEMVAQGMNNVHQSFVDEKRKQMQQATGIEGRQAALLEFRTAVKDREDSDEGYLKRGDRILALMVAHKCTNLPTEPFRTKPHTIEK